MQRYDDLTELLLQLGDSAMVQAQRLCELVGGAPALEEEVALMNVGLDLVGQARNWLEYAAERINDGRTADDLVFLRDQSEYRNLLMVEQPNGDFGVTMAKQFLFDSWHYPMLQSLSGSSDARIAAVAAKSLKEVTYHLRRSSEWVKRLGDGTDESHQRMQAAIDKVWHYSFELSMPAEHLAALEAEGVIPAASTVHSSWSETVASVLSEATLTQPEAAARNYLSGREGMHTESLGYILAEMQFLPRAYPDANW
jgi:ring-1,2-phenylacetyl-CoA epoxidase subunit PaaC